MGSELISSISVEALIAGRDNALNELRAASDAWERVREPLRRLGIDLPHLGLLVDSHWQIILGEHHQNDNNWEQVRYELDRRGWSRLWQASNVEQLMDSGTRDLLRRSLGKDRWHRDADKLPPLTVENIVSTFAAVHDQRLEFFEKAVEAVFRKLSWDHKTSLPCEFSGKFILTFALERSWTYPHWSPTYSSPLLDLERVLCIIAKAPPPTHDVGVNALRSAPYGQWIQILAGNGQELMQVKGFKNRNLHVRVSDQGHVDELNRIIAKRFPGQLQPPRVYA